MHAQEGPPWPRVAERIHAPCYARITGVGKYIPERHVSNTELEKIIATSDAWIVDNIGVKTRSVIAPGQTIAEMGTRAAADALAMAKRDDIGLVICATNSPDVLYPATACRIAADLGLGHIPAYDLQAGCTGFLYALTQARGIVEAQGRSALVIGSDALSTGFLWAGDRNAVLFGDGGRPPLFFRLQRNPAFSRRISGPSTRMPYRCIRRQILP